MNKIKRFVNNYIPIFAIVCFALSFFSFIIITIADNNSSFADWLNLGIGRVLRQSLGALSFVPFSIAEVLLISVPLLVTVLIILLIKSRFKRNAFRIVVCFLAVLSLFYTGYVFTFGVSYHTTTVADKMELSTASPSEDEIYDTLIILKEEAEKLLPHIGFSDTGASFTEYSISELSQMIVDGYDRVIAKYPGLGLTNFNQTAKPVIMSQGMTYLEILGIYTYFTGESNINVHFPDYCIPFTIAHEFAHARGIGRENEANFIAFLVCIGCDDPYIRYSGYMNMYEYMASALNRTNKERLKESYKITDTRIKKEIIAYSEFYYANQVELLGDLSGFVNNLYLTGQGTEGIVSYGLVVRLLVSYYNASG